MRSPPESTPSGLECVVAGEEEAAQQAAQVGLRNARRDAADVVQHAGVGVEHLVLVLREVLRGDIVAELERAAGWAFAAGEHADQRGFACAVHADERDAVAAVDGEVDALEHLLGTVVLREIADLDYGTAGGGRLREGEVNDRLFLRQLDALDLVEFLDAALHLLRLGGLIAEAVDEGLKVLDVLALVAVGRFELRAALLLLLQIALVVAVIDVQRLVPYLDDLGDGDVEEVAVVRDEDVAVGIAVQVVLEPVARLKVEMVGRLVEQQQARLCQQQLGQRDAHLPAAGKLLRLPCQSVLLKPRPSSTAPTWASNA